MTCSGNRCLLAGVVLCVCGGLAVAAQRPSEIPGAAQGRQVIRDAQKSVEQDRLPTPSPGPEWQKARSDAKRLLALAQQIHEQVQQGPGKAPANLAGELKEAQKLAKRLREELLL